MRTLRCPLPGHSRQSRCLPDYASCSLCPLCLCVLCVQRNPARARCMASPPAGGRLRLNTEDTETQRTQRQLLISSWHRSACMDRARASIPQPERRAVRASASGSKRNFAAVSFQLPHRASRDPGSMKRAWALKGGFLPQAVNSNTNTFTAEAQRTQRSQRQ